MRSLLFVISSMILGCSHIPWNNESQTKELNETLDQHFEDRIARYPESLTYMGKKQDYDKLNSYSESKAEEEQKIAKQILSELRALSANNAYSESGQLSLKLAIKRYEEMIEDHQWRYYDYPINPTFGLHTGIPSFLINFHRVDTEEDVKAYISRIKEVPRVIDEVLIHLKKQEKQGILLPKFLFSKVFSDINEVLKGRPFQKSKNNSNLKQDFEEKLAQLKLDESKNMELSKEFDQALKTHFSPAYKKLNTYFRGLEKKSDDRAGVWKFPNGEEYYQNQLRRYTTTEMTPESIHQLGLEQTKKIHDQMSEIVSTLGFKGTLQQFFKKLRTSKEFYFPSTDQGRAQYLEQTQSIIANIKMGLPQLFTLFPKADLKVKAVESFREKSAPMAFYTGPAPDGSRPGIYYVNLYNLTRVPKYEMEALAYHEALPGHHMQIAIAQELTGLPKMRKFGGYTAYSEGWGLYAESLPKEIGYYKDPYSEFGRLSLSLLRAGRLVVDTGLHYKKWTREQATEWLNTNTPSKPEDNQKAIDRYIVLPGQATAYMIGQLKIVELRKRAEKALGVNFDLRKFHDELLRHGALPLDVLEQIIEDWIHDQK